MLNHWLRTPARLALPVLLLAVAAPAARAQQPSPEPQQREHVVRRGDTLWDLARAYLQNPFLWRAIYEANRNVVEDPHWIYPAERLVIPPILQRPDTTSPMGMPLSVEMADVSPMVPREVPAEPQVVTTLDLRRPVVPLAEYLAAPWVSPSPERELIGRVVRLADPAAGSERLPSMLHPKERVLLGNLSGRQPRVGDSLMVVRLGRHLAAWGRIVEPLAVLTVEAVSPTVITARVDRQFGDAKIGDPVMPMGAIPTIAAGQAEPVQTGPEGQLIEFLSTEPLHGTTDHAFISVGRVSGVGIGDEFAVYVPARAMDGESADRLPPEIVGTVRVVKVVDRTATVRVLSVNSAALRDGLPVRMIRKMP